MITQTAHFHEDANDQLMGNQLITIVIWNDSSHDFCKSSSRNYLMLIAMRKGIQKSSSKEETFQELRSVNISRFSIFKVFQQLRKVNEKAYEPQVLAIGPYHHGSAQLQQMEEHKLQYLSRLLHRRSEEYNHVSLYVSAMRKLEETTRKCYADSFTASSDDFVEMMLLDGCFLVELIRKYAMTELIDDHDPLFILPLNFWIPPYARTSPGKVIDRYSLKFIRCATELREAGVKFRRADSTNTLFDVKFEQDGGILVVPTLTVEDETESFLRNLIAYEQLPLKSNNNASYVTDYMVLMDCLVDSREDVELLRRCGIIENRLGDDEVVANLFNRLGDYVGVSHSYFSYCDVFEGLNQHCGKKRYKWLDKLRHDYFSSPWALVSFLAAFVLILLAFIQTLYSGLAYVK
ncbi:UPF0481 protein At3g47200 [Linum grandiflorum]